MLPVQFVLQDLGTDTLDILFIGDADIFDSDGNHILLQAYYAGTFHLIVEFACNCVTVRLGCNEWREFLAREKVPQKNNGVFRRDCLLTQPGRYRDLHLVVDRCAFHHE